MKFLLAGVIAAFPLFAKAQQDCYAEMWRKPELQLIAQRLDTSKPGSEAKLRASTAKPSTKEKEALALMLDSMMACQKLAHEARKDTMHPDAQAIARAYEMESNSLVTRLFSSRITWGEFVEGRDRAWSDMVVQAQTVNAKIQAQTDAWAAEMQKRKQLAEEQIETNRKAALRADFERQQQADAMQRQSEADRQAQAQRDVMNSLLLMQAARPQPRPNPPMTPSINCVSRPGVGSVFTTCN